MTETSLTTGSATSVPSPRISFLTPAYRTEAYLADTIASVRAQTRADWELVVVDNGGSDEVAAIVDRFAGDERIRLVRQENRGYAGGVMAAAAEARGDYLCVLDSDDLLMPDFAETMLGQLASHPDVDAIGCDAYLFVDGESQPFGRGYLRSIGSPIPSPGGDRLTLEQVLGGRVPYYTALVRRQAWDAVGGYDPGVEDVDESVLIWLRLAGEFHVRLLPDRLAKYRVRPDSLSRDPDQVAAFERALMRAFEVFVESSPDPSHAAIAAKPLRRLRYHQALRRARQAFADGDVRSARAFARDAFIQRRTARVGAILLLLHVAPGLLRRVQPLKRSVAGALRRARPPLPVVAEAPAGRPRVLVEHSEYWLSNLGDLALMEVTIRRLRERMPTARIGVFTNAPSLLHAYFPGVDAIEPRGGRPWRQAGPVLRLAEKLGPHRVGPPVILWLTVRAWLPAKARGAVRRARRLLRRVVAQGAASTVPADPAPVRVAPRPGASAALSSTSLLVAMGGGYLTDQDPRQAERVLGLVEEAAAAGTPVAMLGQGLGPIDDPALFAKACSVLPKVDLIGVRERRRGPAILERAGVSSVRVEVTGDDAIELAHARARAELGSDIGVCLRVAGYSQVSRATSDMVASALQDAARALGVGLVPLVIAEYRSQDRRATLPLVRDFPDARPPLRRYARPEDVIDQVGECRVVVTGAYHAAVFALSQGIPVVGLSASTYYDDKLLGLFDMFGGALQLVDLREGAPEQDLAAATRDAWHRAASLRPALLRHAAVQVEASRHAFDRACEL